MTTRRWFLSMLKEIKYISLEELKFNMVGTPSTDENDQFRMSIHTFGKDLKKIDDYYQFNILIAFIIGKDAAIEGTPEEVIKKVALTNNHFLVNQKISFTVRNENDILNDKGELVLTDELRDQLFTIVEPYFRELMENMFSRNEFPTPPLPFQFWRYTDATE